METCSTGPSESASAIVPRMGVERYCFLDTPDRGDLRTLYHNSVGFGKCMGSLQFAILCHKGHTHKFVG